MNNFTTFIMRLILGFGLAVILSKIFRPEMSILHIAFMATGLISIAYILEIFRR